MNNIRNKKAISLIFVGVVCLIAWFYWMSAVTAKTTRITNKVEEDLGTGVQIVERDAPRILYTNVGYYVPDINANLPGNTLPWSKVYDIVLENLNQDINVPMCKVTNVTMHSDSTNISAYATLKFELFPGITKTITVMKSVPTPHYKNPTGDGTVN